MPGLQPSALLLATWPRADLGMVGSARMCPYPAPASSSSDHNEE